MAIRKVIVFNPDTGRKEVQQAGDTLDGVTSASRELSLINSNTGTVNICQAVHVSNGGEFDLSQANASGTSAVRGLIKSTSVANGATGVVLTNGVLLATTAQWDAVTGQTGGLTPGADYYLSKDTAGSLVTSLSGFGAGNWRTRIGYAISATELEVEPGEPLKLA